MLPLQFKQPDIEVPADSVLLNKFEERIDKLTNMTWSELTNTVINDLIRVGGKILLALVIFFAGRWLIRKIDGALGRMFERRGMDTSLNAFIRNILRIVAWLFLLMIVISILGIKTTSFLAILASAGFAVGMALSGTLQNFAGGVLILLLKPFRTGDYIVAQGEEGTVKAINLFNTILVTADNKTIIVPNGGLSTSIVNNVSQSGMRRVEWKFAISYGDDYDKARELLKKLIENDSRIQTKPPYFIALNALADSAVEIVVRVWTKTADFWDVYFDMNEKVYKVFPEYGLTIPYNKLDVTVVPAAPEAEAPGSSGDLDDILRTVGAGSRADDNCIDCIDLGMQSDNERDKEISGDMPGDTDGASDDNM